MPNEEWLPRKFAITISPAVRTTKPTVEGSTHFTGSIYVLFCAEQAKLACSKLGCTKKELSEMFKEQHLEEVSSNHLRLVLDIVKSP